MKKLRISIMAFVILFLLVITLPANAQTKVTKSFQNDALLIEHPLTSIVSTDTVYSIWFGLNDYNKAIGVSTLGNYTKILTSASSKPRITTLIQGSNDQTNVFVLDTLGIVADSIETAQKGTFDLNEINNSNRFQYYRFVQIGESSNPADAKIKQELYIIK